MDELDIALEHHVAGRLDLAEQGYRRVLERDANDPDARHLLGVVFHQRQEHERALEWVLSAIELCPTQSSYYNNLGEIYRSLGRYPEAEKAYRQSLELFPDTPDTIGNLGLVLEQQGRFPESVSAFCQAIELDPERPEHHYHLGNVWRSVGDFDQARRCYDEAIALRPQFSSALNNLANCYREMGRLEVAEATYRRAIEADPKDSEIYSNWLFCQNYLPRITSAELAANHRRWGELFALPRSLSHGTGATAGEREPGPMRVGYVSPDFRSHAVALFFEGVLVHHDPSRVQVFLYSESRKVDATTDRFRRGCFRWYETTGRSDQEVIDRIRQDRVDILVDLAGHSAGNRLRVFSARPAPVQLSYLGYPHATGVPGIDYRISDSVADPDEEASVEPGLRRLNPCFCAFYPPMDAPAVNTLPAYRRGYVTLGSLHGLMKLNAEVLDAWAQILRAVPTAHLRMFRDTLRGSAVDYFLREFAERGVGADRLEFEHRLPDGVSHLEQYHQIDLTLDPFPWSGHTTSTESLWMGVPAVTCRGSRFAGRMTASVLTAVGHPELIAESVAEYIEVTIRLANDWNRLAGYRETLRRGLESSPVGDSLQFTRELESLYQHLLPPS